MKLIRCLLFITGVAMLPPRSDGFVDGFLDFDSDGFIDGTWISSWLVFELVIGNDFI